MLIENGRAVVDSGNLDRINVKRQICRLFHPALAEREGKGSCPSRLLRQSLGQRVPHLSVHDVS